MPNRPGEYVRRSVGRDIQEFEGWPKLLSRYQKIKDENPFDVSQVYAGAFLTGGRINEVLNLNPEMFTFKMEIIPLQDGREIARDVLEVNRMPLEKRFKKLYTDSETVSQLPLSSRKRLFPPKPDADGNYTRKTFKTEKVKATRKPFDIPFDEVQTKFRVMHLDFKEYLDQMKAQEWLFESHTKNTHMTDSYIWKVFNKYGIYPHYLRGQRASCLIAWNGLSMEQMMEWMSWEELKTAMHYGKMGKSKLLSVFKRYE